jgi:hypothetical protein
MPVFSAQALKPAPSQHGPTEQLVFAQAVPLPLNAPPAARQLASSSHAQTELTQHAPGSSVAASLVSCWVSTVDVSATALSPSSDWTVPSPPVVA